MCANPYDYLQVKMRSKIMSCILNDLKYTKMYLLKPFQNICCSKGCSNVNDISCLVIG